MPFIERMVRVTRRLDSTRPVIDNDGWEHTDITDICAIPRLHADCGKTRRLDTKETLKAESCRRRFGSTNRCSRAAPKYRGQPIILSEVGGFLGDSDEIPPEKRDLLYQVLRVV
jgi:hypothetical protein